MKNRKIVLASLTLVTLAVVSCGGRSASRLFRQGQSPVFDFPLYVSEGATGNVWKYAADRTRTLLIGGLVDPRGIATDRANNLYVVEQGTSRLLKVNTTNGSSTVVAEALQTPNVVAVNSFGEAFVAEEGSNKIIRAADGKVITTLSSRPTSLAFGVDDILIFGLFDDDKVQWSIGGATASVTDPVAVGTDGNGRVYVAEGSTNNARLLRFHQKEPTGETVVANELSGLSGMAVDPVGNVYIIEQGSSRINIISTDAQLYSWATDTIDPQYLAFTQY